MKISNQQLIDELRLITKTVISDTEALSVIPIDQLNYKASSEAWSAIECIAHLNRYSAFYVPEIKGVLDGSSKTTDRYFKPGVLGNYFAKSMQVKPKLNKMKTFKNMNPIYSQADESVIQTFIAFQKETLKILDQALLANLTKLKTGITISKLIKLRLGDTLRVVVYHNERHLEQAKRALSKTL